MRGRLRIAFGASSASMASVLLTFALFMLVMALPVPAFASQPGYSEDRIATDLYVETNASIHVVERHVLTFDQPNTGMVWYIHEAEPRESVKVTSVRAVLLGEGGEPAQDWMQLQLVDSNPAAQGLKPGDSCAADLRGPDARPWYSYNISDGMLRCYFPTEASTYLVEIDYLVMNRVQLYRDVGDLKWRYAQSDMPVDAADVTLRIALPLPVNAEVSPNTTVQAWGHGPADGSFSIGEDGSVVFHADVVQAGHYAEAHVLFPVHWLDNVASDSPRHRTEAHKADAIAEETDWVDVSARASIWDNRVRVLFLPLIVLAALVGIIIAARFGRSALTRRWLVRIAVTLGVVAGAEQMFFSEPITTFLLLMAAVVIGVVAICLPDGDDVDEDAPDVVRDGEQDAAQDDVEDSAQDGAQDDAQDSAQDGAQDDVEELQ